MPTLREQFAAAAKTAAARPVAPAKASPFRACALRGQQKIGERECIECRGRALLTVYACPKHPEGVTYKDCRTCPAPEIPRSSPPAKIEYGFDYYEHMIRDHTTNAHLLAVLRWRFIEPARAMTILDYGCGLGAFRAFRPPNVEVDTWDINPKLPTTGIRRENYDLITLWDVLEHMPDESALLPLLRRAKWVALTVPIRPPAVPREFWKHTRPGEHLREFTMDSLKALFAGYGYDLRVHGTPETPPRADAHSFLFQRRRKIILRNVQHLGDGIAISRALEDVKATFPTWKVDTRTPCPQLYSACPHITPLDEKDPEVEVHTLSNDPIHRSNQDHLTYWEGWSRGAEKALGVTLKRAEVPVVNARGDLDYSTWTPKLYLTDAEKQRPTEYPKAFWLLNAGWWTPNPCKRYPFWQQVVDLFKAQLPGVEIIQIGHSSPLNNHQALNGTINMIGKGDRDLRILLRQMYHADGVLTNCSGPMVMAAALDKPCVTVAGGREPFQWLQTTHTRLLCSVGQLPCCTPFSCWKTASTDCHAFDQAAGAARCMTLIRPEEVVREAVKFYEGGRLKLPAGSN